MNVARSSSNGRSRRLARLPAVTVAIGLLAAACGGLDLGGGDGPGDCLVVPAAVSSEKITLMSDLARSFNDSGDSEGDGTCWFVEVRSKASGGATSLLVEGWPNVEVEGPQPVVWSPASSAWGAVLNQRLSERGEAPMVAEATPFMLTPLVIAMPQPMAEALGWPDDPIGFADILELANSPDGWADFGHPEWGPFKLGKTNPNFSTSGLSMAMAQYYAATDKQGDLTLEDLRRPDVAAYTDAIESAVVHYGDTTLTFLNNWYRADQRGSALDYASAVAVEEVSVISYNQGNPDGVLEAGEEPVPPRVPLVAVYPEEGTLFSDNPFIVLDAPWVSADAAEGARRFGAFVQEPENQERVLEFGFRPGNPAVAVSDPIVAANGVDPNQPQNLLRVPEPAVLTGLLDRWAEQRKRAQVILLLDVSGSMGELVDGSSDDSGRRLTKLDLAKSAAVRALDQFEPDDRIGLWLFSTELPPGDADFIEVVPVDDVSGNRGRIVEVIENLFPQRGTPLYTATAAAYDAVTAAFDPERINAVVVLSDGMNDDPNNDDLDGLLRRLQIGREGNPFPVRVFPIAYGDEADLSTLRSIAEATDAAVYDSSDPASIDKVFTAVISNF